MAVAIILSTIQRLESFRIELKYITTMMEIDGIVNELRMIVDFLRHKKLVNGSRLYYFTSDLLQLVMDINNMDKDDPLVFFKAHDLRKSVTEVKMRMLQFGANGVEAQSSVSMRSDDQEHAIGLQKDVKVLLRRLTLKDDQGLLGFTITGMIGIGKTTLARQLYNHSTVTDQFDCRAWVHVSRDLSQKEILMKLIQQVVDCEKFQNNSLLKRIELADNRSLQDMLFRHLQGTAYFIVLDGVHKEFQLGSILNALPNDRGILLLTSRSQDVGALYAVFGKNIYVVKPLDTECSWKLFLETVWSGNNFTNSDFFPKQLEGRGKDIIRKCGGVPLAIKHLGKRIAEKRRSGSGWEEILESIDFGSTLKLFEPIYHDLDPQTRPCFLCLAFFKENITMRVEKLKQILGAGGMVPISYQFESCFRNLSTESIIHIKETRNSTERKRFGINVMLHMLSVQKAVEEMSFEIIGKEKSYHSYEERPRHRVINCSRIKFNYSANQDNHLVSLFFHGGGYIDNSPSYWKSLEQLRILDLEDFGLKILSDTIGTLMELRYLGLRNNYIEKIPRSLGCLKNLEVFDIAQNFMVEVPDILWEMVNLRHLYMSEVICEKPLKIETLHNLETLTYISVDNWTYELSNLEKMTSLHKLGIEGLDGNSDVRKIFASLDSLTYLRSLILRGFPFKSMPCLDDVGILRDIYVLKIDGLLTKLPSANNFPLNIHQLVLINVGLDEDPMPVLGKLPKLNRLVLQNAYTGQQMVILQGGFPILVRLYIEDMWNLRNIQVGEGAMASIRGMEINNCPYLEILPVELESMRRLESLTMVTTKTIEKKIEKSFLISRMNLGSPLPSV